MPKPPDPLRSFLSGSSAKKGRRGAPIRYQSAPLPTDPPAEMPEAAAKHWRRVVADSPRGILAASDAIALQLLCELLAEKDEMGGEMQTSRLSIIRSLLADLGMMPVARQRLIAALGLQASEEPDGAGGWDGFCAA